MKLTGKQFLIIGFFLVLYGMVVPWLMFLQIIKANFFLSFTSYGATFTGLMFAVIGAGTYIKDHRNDDK